MLYKKFSIIHNKFVSTERYISKHVFRKLKKLNIITKITQDDDEIITLESKDILLTQGTLRLSYEAMTPIMRLSGNKQKLFIFIAAYLVEHESFTFKWNPIIVDACLNYFEQVTGISPKASTIQQEFKELKLEHNIVRKVSKDTYMFNPLYLPRQNSDYKNKKLFNDFNKSVVEKGSDALSFMNIDKEKPSKNKV